MPRTESVGDTIGTRIKEGVGRKGQRSSNACRRCRRYRQKCVMPERDGKQGTPCEGCIKGGGRAISECHILPRGYAGGDREFRRKRIRRDSTSPGEAPTPSDGSKVFVPVVRSSLLPPQEEVIEGVRVFTRDYMQLGFLSRSIFLDQVSSSDTSISEFLLLAILALAARFTAPLIKRFGSPKQASTEMHRRALSIVGEEMMEPTLQRMQALFLLGVNDFGEGNGGRSWLLTGIAIRMASTLRLHRETTYALGPSATPEQVSAAEMARRSFWLVYCHDQQIAGRAPSTTFPAGSVDVLLPAEEDDFVFGVEPIYRPALPGTAGVAAAPHGQPSLFATMIVGQWYWARTAEQAAAISDPAKESPWDLESDFHRIDADMTAWERGLPAKHKFSAFTLRAMKGPNLDLGFASISVLLRLSHIVLRRATRSAFWRQMAKVMVDNAFTLYGIMEQMLANRTINEGFPAVFIFALHMCGDIAHSLSRWPQLAPDKVSKCSAMLQFAVRTLEKLETVWPLATRWRITLTHLIFSSATHDSLNDTTSSVSIDLGRNHGVAVNLGSPAALSELNADPPSWTTSIDDGLNSTLLSALESSTIDCGPFGADLTAFIRGELVGWEPGGDADGPAQSDGNTFDVENLLSVAF